MARKPFFPYARQSIDASDVKRVTKALKSDVITRGASVELFEEKVREYCDVEFAVAFNSGSSALAAAYFAAELSVADTVVSTPNTFVASIAPAVQKGCRVLLADVDPSTGNVDLESCREQLAEKKSRGKQIFVPVHYAGVPLSMKEAEQMLSDPSSVIIEDGAHALGATYPEGGKVGGCQFSQMTIFSFHPAKVITTGEGGMVTTNDPKLARRLRLYRNNGLEREEAYLEHPPTPWWYEIQELSGNFNMTELQGALGASQMSRLDSFVEKRRHLVREYRRCLKGVEGIALPPIEEDSRSAHHLCVARIDFERLGKSRQELMELLLERGVGTQVHYIPLYLQPFFQKKVKGQGKESFPGMEQFYFQALSLPLYPDLNGVDVEAICDVLKSLMVP